MLQALQIYKVRLEKLEQLGLLDHIELEEFKELLKTAEDHWRDQAKTK